jgi:hypothetical protein
MNYFIKFHKKIQLVQINATKLQKGTNYLYKVRKYLKSTNKTSTMKI